MHIIHELTDWNIFIATGFQHNTYKVICLQNAYKDHFLKKYCTSKHVDPTVSYKSF